MFSQTVEYALRAMVCLATSDHGPLTADEISQRTRLKGGYLSKVMRDLVIAGLVGSQRGPNGGFTIARPATEISILDVVTAVDPIKRITQCPMGNPSHVKLCSLHQRLDNAIGEIERVFGSTSLAEVIQDDQGPAQCRALTTPAPVRVTLPNGTGTSG